MGPFVSDHVRPGLSAQVHLGQSGSVWVATKKDIKMKKEMEKRKMARKNENGGKRAVSGNTVTAY